MTIRFVTAWNGYHADQIVSGLGSPEENRLIGLGFSVADIDGPGNTPLPVTATTNLTGGSDFLSEVSTLKLPAGVTDLTEGFGGGAGSTAYTLNSTGADQTSQLIAMLTDIQTDPTVFGATIVIKGDVLIAGQVRFPNDGASPRPTQKPVRITGDGSSANGRWEALPIAPSSLNLTYSGAQAKIITTGLGLLEIDHVMLRCSTVDSTPFIKTTNTTVRLHDCAVVGSKSGVLADQDIMIFGGINAVFDGTDESSFQGYGSSVKDNFFSKVRRILLQHSANNIVISDNTFSNDCGSNIKQTITAATNANPCVLTATAHGMKNDGVTHVTGSTNMTFDGFTGAWATLNGVHAVTFPSTNTISVTGFDSSAFGAMSGTPIFNHGGAIELGTVSGTPYGNIISGNLFEVAGYAWAMVINSNRNYIAGNGTWDPTATTLGAYLIRGSGNTLLTGYNDAVGDMEVCGANTSNSINRTNGGGGYGISAYSFRSDNYFFPPKGSNANPCMQPIGVGNSGQYCAIATYNFVWVDGGVDQFGVRSTGLSFGSAKMASWSSTTAPTGAIDTAIGRSSAGVAEVNTGTLGTLASLRAKDLTIKPSPSVAPANNGELTFEATSNTSMTVKYKGSDGTVRSTVLTLS